MAMHTVKAMVYRNALGRVATITHTSNGFAFTIADPDRPPYFAQDGKSVRDVWEFTRDLRTQGFTLTGEGE